MKKNDLMIPIERIENKILLIREQKVLLDRDLAELYGVETRVLKQAVRRNIRRFPEDFMFELTKEEFANWRSQIVMSNSEKMGLRHSPMAFTEQGVSMLSSVLNSEQAITVNIAIMRAFVRMREMLLSNAKLAAELRDIEDRIDTQEMNAILLMDRLRAVEKKIKGSAQNPKDKKKIGFHRE